MSGSLLNAPAARLSRRRSAALFAACAALFVGLAVAPAAAAPVKDADAEKVLKEAMDSDYFETRFAKAEEKLRAAIDACGTTCSAGVKAKLYIALGTVLAGGKKELEDAREAFVEGLKLDAKAVPDPDLVSGEVTFAFEKAKTELKIGGATPAAGGGATHKAPAAQRVRTPVPLYIEVSPESITDVRKVTGSYAGPGTETFSPLSFRKIGERGYGAEVPCEEVAKEGELRYFATILGEGDKVIATFGTRTEPLRVPLRKTIASDAPKWPGFSAPEQCSSGVGDPSQCLDDRQCNPGLVCRSGQCVLPPVEKKKLSNWVTVTFAPDFALYSAENVCTQAGQIDDHYVCLRKDGSRYRGTPTADVGDNVKFGFVPGTMRVAAQYERVIFDNLTAAIRLGFAFNGATGSGADFLPVHIEARLGYSLGKQAFEGPGLRPFGFIGGGVAQVDSKVEVHVLEDGNACSAKTPSDPTSPCESTSPDGRKEKRVQDLDAFKQAGTGFVTLGVGLAYTPIRNVGFHLALRGGVTLPVAVGIIAPEAGVTVGF
jgi:hypothetical protein